MPENKYTQAVFRPKCTNICKKKNTTMLSRCHYFLLKTSFTFSIARSNTLQIRSTVLYADSATIFALVIAEGGVPPNHKKLTNPAIFFPTNLAQIWAGARVWSAEPIYQYSDTFIKCLMLLTPGIHNFRLGEKNSDPPL